MRMPTFKVNAQPCSSGPDICNIISSFEVPDKISTLKYEDIVDTSDVGTKNHC